MVEGLCGKWIRLYNCEVVLSCLILYIIWRLLLGAVTENMRNSCSTGHDELVKAVFFMEFTEKDELRVTKLS